MDTRSSPGIEQAATPVQEALAILKWLREPDYAEEFSLEDLTDWLNRRPVAQMCRVVDACVAPAYAPAWQPMETAPKDGTRVLLAEQKPIKDVSIARWVSAPHDVWIADRGNYIRRPTGWMPMPDASTVSSTHRSGK
jgi:hypothetical protein